MSFDFVTVSAQKNDLAKKYCRQVRPLFSPFLYCLPGANFLSNNEVNDLDFSASSQRLIRRFYTLVAANFDRQRKSPRMSDGNFPSDFDRHDEQSESPVSDMSDVADENSSRFCEIRRQSPSMSVPAKILSVISVTTQL